jgi:hypothetical protein
VAERLAERVEGDCPVTALELVEDLAAATPAGAPASVVVGWADDLRRHLGAVGMSVGDGEHGIDRWPAARVAALAPGLLGTEPDGPGRSSGDAGARQWSRDRAGADREVPVWSRTAVPVHELGR